MRNEIIPDPNNRYPVPGFDNVTYVRPIIQKPNIIGGGFYLL